MKAKLVSFIKKDTAKINWWRFRLMIVGALIANLFVAPIINSIRL